jgi:hypothetical protein
VAKNLDRRIRHVLVVLRRTRFSEILEFPWFIFAGLYVLLERNASDLAKVRQPASPTETSSMG